MTRSRSSRPAWSRSPSAVKHCWTDGVWADGTNRWFLVTGLGWGPYRGRLTSIRGFVSATRIKDQALVGRLRQLLPECWDSGHRLELSGATAADRPYVSFPVLLAYRTRRHNVPIGVLRRDRSKRGRKQSEQR